MKSLRVRPTALVLRAALVPLLATSLLACEPSAQAAPAPSDAKGQAKAGARQRRQGRRGKDKSPDPVLPHSFRRGGVDHDRQRDRARPADRVSRDGRDARRPREGVGRRLPARGHGAGEKGGQGGRGEARGEDDLGGGVDPFYGRLLQGRRPVRLTPHHTFFYNGGPGSSTVWLHMGAFGPKRVVTPGDRHPSPSAPYALVNNEWSLLDTTDLVFIDAPGAGFSRIAGPDKEKSFYGVDQDAQAFADFITQFLAKYGRWNSPKYIFGESYGTTRSAVLIGNLEVEHSIDFNGVILLSSPDPELLALSRRRRQRPGAGPPLRARPSDVRRHGLVPPQARPRRPRRSEGPRRRRGGALSAVTEYALALQQGAALPEADRAAIAAKLHKYTSLPIEYLRKWQTLPRDRGGVR